MTNQATRLIHLIMLLQRKPNQKAADLAQALGVSVRSLHRYFARLDEMGIPVYSERGPYGGFSLVRGYRMPPVVFTPEEAAAASLGANLVEATWGKLYGEAARGALAKLENVLPDEQRQEAAWARRALHATGTHLINVEAIAPMLETLRQAARAQRQVCLRYGNPGRQEPTERVIDPYALVCRWGYWYLIGYCHLRRALRTFRIDRILAAELLDERFELAPGFDLADYLVNEFKDQPQVCIRMRFEPEWTQAALDNRAGWDTFQPQPDGAMVVTFRAPSLEWAASAVLTYGPLVEVLEPPELRRMVSEWVEILTQKYAGQGEKTAK